MSTKLSSKFLSLLVIMLTVSACSVLPGSLSLNSAANPPVAVQQVPQLPASNTQSKSAQLADTSSLEQSYIQLFKAVNPSVVNIEVVLNASASSQSSPQFPFGQGGNSPQQGPQEALGTGFVYDTQGHIITNNHVVDGATRVLVTFSDGTQVSAKVVGRDPDSDLAVVKVNVDPSLLHPVQFANSQSVQVGQIVVALGNPYGLQNSMSTGIVSGLGRMLPANSQGSNGVSYSIPDMIQTDAAINPGNSGGPLVNLEGQVIGVNSAIESPVQANSGVGYSIPSSIVLQVVPQLIKNGKVEHPYLGISGGTLNSDMAKAMKLDANQRGVIVVDVTKGSPAEKAGIRGSTGTTQVAGLDMPIGGDVITAINGTSVKVFDDLLSYLITQTKVGDTVTLTIIRDGKAMDVQVTLVARPQS